MLGVPILQTATGSSDHGLQGKAGTLRTYSSPVPHNIGCKLDTAPTQQQLRYFLNLDI